MQMPPPPPGGMPQGMPQAGPGGRPMPSPEQIQAMQQQFLAEAEKRGMTAQQFAEHIKAERMAQIQRLQQQAQQQGGQPGGPPGAGPQQGGPRPGQPMRMVRPPNAGPQPQPIRPGPPNPTAIALANFLRGQQLKPRTSIFNGERKDMFKVKRALRALESPAYAKARAKNPSLPEITDRASLENAFKLLPMSMLALRVSKIDPNAAHAGHAHAPPKKGKRVKGLWNVKIEQQQEAKDDMYYIWLYEGSKTMRMVYAALALIVVFIIVLYPLWPLVLRQGVYYLSWGFLGLLGLFFLMAIFRVILFAITYFVASPGLWLYPNLWEDVSFLDSFRPVWAWHETAKPKKKKKGGKGTGGTGGDGGGGGGGGPNTDAASHFAGTTGQAPPASATTNSTTTQMQTEAADGGEGSSVTQRTPYQAPQVEEEE